MEIILEQKVKEFLKSKGEKSVTINNIPTKGCCGSTYLPAVKIGEPGDKTKYNFFKVEGDINVYVEKNIEAKNEKLYLNLRNFILFKDIDVDGVKLL